MAIILRMEKAPALGLLLAVLWLAGMVTGSFPLAAAAVVLGLLAPAWGAVSRREPREGRRLAAGLVVLGTVLALFLGVLRPGALSGPPALALEVLVLGAGALGVPLLYAATFPVRKGSGR